MLKNVNFLYGIIAVLLVICVLCGIHISTDRAMMYENRYFFLYYIGGSIDISSKYAKQTLDNPFGSDSFESGLYWTRNSLESASDKVEFLLKYYPHTYNIVNKTKDFTVYSPSDTYSPFSLDFVFSGLVNEAEMIIAYYEENGSLKDEHILWLKTLSSAADEFIEELYEEGEEGLELKEKYYKKDKEFCFALGDFLDKMYVVSIR
ncbi:MAG: hypothetical protein IJF04_00625 [Oscillospiraceae bacterium]|nr:hypothetical protein [Oscillospiraceae bacterium]